MQQHFSQKLPEVEISLGREEGTSCLFVSLSFKSSHFCLFDFDTGGQARDKLHLMDHVLLNHHRLPHHLHRQLLILLVSSVTKEDLAKGAS